MKKKMKKEKEEREEEKVVPMEEKSKKRGSRCHYYNCWLFFVTVTATERERDSERWKREKDITRERSRKRNHVAEIKRWVEAAEEGAAEGDTAAAWRMSSTSCSILIYCQCSLLTISDLFSDSTSILLRFASANNNNINKGFF
ncbi:uncharacterized protein DS421_5g146350 [Arachis hypogaea]|nr:uncharacterized protein DS421_5g146350 [Arachis hypogaea]